MTTITYGAVPASRTRKPSIWSRLLARLIEARSRQADRLVRAHLMSIDAPTLTRLGYDRDVLLKTELPDKS